MGCFSPSKPADRSYGGELQQTLGAQTSLAPQQYSAEAQWQPKYAQLALGNLGVSLAGNAAAGSGGLAGLWGNVYPSVLNSTATGTTGALQNYGNNLVQAYIGADPAAASMLNTLTNQTGSQLNMGANLDPSLMRLATQAVRSNQAGMLGGTGSAGTYGEALGLSAFGQQLRQQRQANAGTVLGLRQRYSAPALQGVLGTGSSMAGQMFGMAPGISAMAGPSLFNPESAYAGNLYNANQQMAAQFADPSTMAKLNMIQQHIGGDVQIAGSVAGMAGV